MSVSTTKYGNARVGVLNGTNNGILKTVIKGATQAKALAPEDKGELRNSIGYTGFTSNKVVSGGYNNTSKEKTDTYLESKGSNLEGYYGTALDYAPWIEGGTRVMVPQKFLAPSADILDGSKTVSEVKKELNLAMQKEVKNGTRATRTEESRALFDAGRIS